MSESLERDAKRDDDALQSPVKPVTLATLAQSVFAGFFGVQSEANRKRDFESGQFWHFVVGGLLFVLLFIGAIVVAARLVAGG